MEPIHTLFERQGPDLTPALPEELRAVYGGDLRFPAVSGRPYVIGNFVSTLDGVVSYGIPGKSGGGDISGFNQGDRFIMGLLRASVDAVMVGAATLHEAGRRHLFTAESIYPSAGESYANYRRGALNKPQHPVTVIVSGSGRVDFEIATFHAPEVRSVIVTTDEGKERLLAQGAATLASTQVRVIQAQGSLLSPVAILELLWREFGVRLLLHEGGPALFGSFVVQGLVDEFFLTVAPQLAGRNPRSTRPGMISGVEFSPGDAPWLELLSVKQSGDHLYMRHRTRRQPEA
jgi:riboflavin biosynthesis pyrimidine reductase